jgi:hypothetical protein
MQRPTRTAQETCPPRVILTMDKRRPLLSLLSLLTRARARARLEAEVMLACKRVEEDAAGPAEFEVVVSLVGSHEF